MAAKLTARQQEVFNVILEHIRLTGFPPTRAEIADKLGFRSANAAEEHLRALARKGAITLTAGASRGIRLNPDFIVDGDIPAAFTEADPIDSPSSAHLVSLPVIGRVAAGSPVLAQAHIEKAVEVSPALFERPADYLLRVKGESMIDIGIHDGDLLAVKKSESARNGQIVVARINDEVTVKRLDKQGNRINLLAENPDFEPIVVTPEDEFAIEGLAVGLIRSIH